MTLQELYDKYEVNDRILKKRILFLLPAKDYDVASALEKFKLDPYEVALTYPKLAENPEEFMLMEAQLCGAEIVLQVGMNISRKYPTLDSPNISERIQQALGDRFVNLHHHDDFSVRDGLGTVDTLLELLKARKASFCSITNHGSVGGWIKQYSACKTAGVKPLFGLEAYQNEYRGDDRDELKKHRSNYHLVLLAKNLEGFYNIIQIHNDAQLKGFYYKPRTTFESLKKWGKGIIGSSACMSGLIPQLLLAGKEEEATAVYERYKEAFDEFYIEITMIEMKEQVELSWKLVQFAKKVGAPLLLTCDSHYLYPEHAETHDILLLIKNRKTIFDKRDNPEEVWQFEVKNLYYRSCEDMFRLFREGFPVDGEMVCYENDVFTEEVFWEAIENSRKIALSIDNIRLDSSFKLPKLYDNADETLRTKAKEGFAKRGLRGKQYSERLNFELDVICNLGYADYFLVVDKIIRDAKEEFGEWATGWGRGSAAGSLVSYCLEITDLDPIKYGLLFERFLDYSRKDDVPDIDTDFDSNIKEWVKNHIVEAFGEEKTCSIGTYQTYKTKAVILDVARVFGLNIMEISAITKQMDSLAKFEIGQDEGDSEAIKLDEMDFDEIIKHYPDLGKYFEEHPDIRRHVEVLRNQIKNMSKHAAGMIISNLDLHGKIPVYRDKDGDILSAWSEGQDTHELSAVGLVKFDILGLSNLSIISDCLKMVEKTTGRSIGKREVALNDKEAIRFGSREEMVGIFQFENPITQQIVDDIGMESIFDIAAVTSLIRPGPKDEGMHEEYGRRKKGDPYKKMSFLEDVLAETYFVITYQEQVQLVAQKVAGLSPVESNRLRKVLIKEKNEKVLAELRKKFMEGAQERVKRGEMTAAEVKEIYEKCKSFAKYGFNRCLAQDTMVETPDGYRMMSDVSIGERIKAITRKGKEVFVEIRDIYHTESVELFEVTFSSGKQVVVSMSHKFLCSDMIMRTLAEVLEDGHEVVCEEE